MLGELERGAIRTKIYGQFKMYNDPALNSQLYGKMSLPQAAPDPDSG
jgi:hypothetical protein